MDDLQKALEMRPTKVYYNGVLIKENGKDVKNG